VSRALLRTDGRATPVCADEGSEPAGLDRFDATRLPVARAGGADAISIPNISERSWLTSTFAPPGPIGVFERPDPAFAIRPCWSTFRSVARASEETQRFAERKPVPGCDRFHRMELEEHFVQSFAIAVDPAAAHQVLTAFSVSQRRRELGIRLAVGAQPTSVVWLVQRGAAVLAAVGAAAGFALATAASTLLGSLLVGIGPVDAAAFGVALALLRGRDVPRVLDTRTPRCRHPVEALRAE